MNTFEEPANKKKEPPKPRPLQEPLQQGQQNSTWPTLPCGSAVQALLLLDTRAGGLRVAVFLKAET